MDDGTEDTRGACAAEAPPAEPVDALALLQPFAERLLPGAVRRMGFWRGLSLHARQELAAELRQELALDCLQHDAEIRAMARHERHSRWFRLLERSAYRWRARAEHVPLDTEGERAAPPPPTPESLRELLPGVDQRLVVGLAGGADLLHNGRCNVKATARRAGVNARSVREAWERLADRLGYGDEFVGFWRRRLAEALLGLAADLLRDRAGLRTWQRRRAPPDPEGRLQRIRRIHATLQLRPVPAEVKHAIAPWLRRPRLDRRAPVRLLASAAVLDPANAAIHLWRFEAAALDGTPAAAARALRAARRCDGVDPVAHALARARFAELRRREAAAAAILRRALARRPRDERLLRAAAAFA